LRRLLDLFVVLAGREISWAVATGSMLGAADRASGPAGGIEAAATSGTIEAEDEPLLLCPDQRDE
jgi:hypothetical protein